MWSQEWREKTWAILDRPWDIVVVGGGITGAGILREATRAGLRVLLVEQKDFGWGTSSRSSKLVHGGLRYLKEGKIFVTLDSVKERQRLIHEAPGLVEPLGFLLAVYNGDFPGRWIYEAGLSMYDLLSLQWSHHYYNADDFWMLAPHIAREGLQGGFRYDETQTDDARLVLRVLSEAVADGGTALNYARAQQVIKEDGKVVGVVLQDMAQEHAPVEVRAKLVINATGAWADYLREQVGAKPRMRPLRGSHLIFPSWRLPVAQCLGILHPVDNRPVFLFPWEGVTLLGTTDLDHDDPLNTEPRITPEEVSYLMAAVDTLFPSLNLKPEDAIASFAGVRPVVGTGKANPSAESRDYVIWEEDGLLTVTGGKLTTFRVIALAALRAARHYLPTMPNLKANAPLFNSVSLSLPGAESLDKAAQRRLVGRYGTEAKALIEATQPGELEPVGDTTTLWAELRWAARSEGVVHLEDLLLRRTRLGILLPQGGADFMERIREICQAELGWDDARWEVEAEAYAQFWEAYYALPDKSLIPEWQPVIAEVKEERAQAIPRRNKRLVAGSLLAGLLLGATAAGTWYWYNRSKA